MAILLRSNNELTSFIDYNISLGKTIGFVGFVNDIKGNIGLSHHFVFDKACYITDITIGNLMPLNLQGTFKNFDNLINNVNFDAIYIDDQCLKGQIVYSEADGWANDYLTSETNLSGFLHPLKIEWFERHKPYIINFFMKKINTMTIRGYKDIIQDMMISGYQGFDNSIYKNTWIRDTFVNLKRVYINMFRDINNSLVSKNSSNEFNINYIIDELSDFSKNINFDTITINEMIDFLDNLSISCNKTIYSLDLDSSREIPIQKIENYWMNYSIVDIRTGKNATTDTLRSKMAMIFIDRDGVNEWYWPGFEDDDYFEVYPDFGFKKIPNFPPFKISSFLSEDILNLPFYNEIKENLIKKEFERRFNEKRGIE